MNRVGRAHSWTPQFRGHQSGVTGHIRTSGVPRGVHLTLGMVPALSGSRVGAACRVTREALNRRPENPRCRRQPCVFTAWEFRGLPRGRRRGRKGVSVGMSVAVLACWRPISQMSFATIKKCGGVKWRFHIQQGKGGFTWELGRLPLEVGGGSFPASQFPLLTSLPEFTPHRDINGLLRPPVAAVSTRGLPLHCGCWVGLGLQGFPFSPSP